MRRTRDGSRLGKDRAARGWRGLASTLALVALAAHIFFGFVHAAVPPNGTGLTSSDSPLAELVEICTPNGIQRVDLRDGSTGPRSPAPEGVADFCQLCNIHGNAFAAQPSGCGIVIAPDRQLRHATAHEQGARSPAAFTRFQSRAPPQIG